MQESGNAGKATEIAIWFYLHGDGRFLPQRKLLEVSISFCVSSP